MGYSCKLKIDKRYQRKDGTAAVFLQVIVNRKKERIGLGICWPVNKFNEVDGCRPRYKADADVDAFNIVIANAREKANKIWKMYLMKGWHLTLDNFLREYNSNLSRDSFIEYFDRKAFERWSTRDTSDQTYKNEKTVLAHLKEYTSVLLFSDFHIKWADGFDKHLRKEKCSQNTRWGYHKVMQTYLALACEVDKIEFEDPYARFKSKLVESNWGPLDINEFTTLLNRYNDWKDNPLSALKRKNGVNQVDTREGLTASEVTVLRKFLFSCNSALRISDMQKLDESLFNNGQMTITPHKTREHGTKITAVPLNSIARQLLNDEIDFVKDKGSRIFEAYTDQACNRLLKRIAVKCNIEKNIHMHVGRYTFASLSDEAGANHTALMKQMGLKKRDTMNKYLKASALRIADNVERLDEFISNSNKKSII